MAHTDYSFPLQLCSKTCKGFHDSMTWLKWLCITSFTLHPTLGRSPEGLTEAVSRLQPNQVESNWPLQIRQHKSSIE